MAQLPLVSKALIPQKKIVGYLLSQSRSSERDKAVFFEHFGFTLTSWETLVQALLQQATQYEIAKQEAPSFGIRYVVEGPLQTPSGRTPQVRSVRFIETGEEAPHFVTAYPLKGACYDC